MIEKTISVIKNKIKLTMPFVLRVSEPEFRVELGDPSVNIQVLVWHPRDDWNKT